MTQVAVGDHVAVSFIPSCGTCFWCASGRQNLCDLGMMTLAGGMISDGTYRYHLGGENLNRMAQLGTFADEMVCHENSVVRINPWDNMKAAALISCGIATGFGSAVDRAKVKPGETVVVVGCGGVGSGADPGRPHRRRAAHHRGGPGALQAREGQGDRRHPHRGVAGRGAVHAARADDGPQRRRGHPHARASSTAR